MNEEMARERIQSLEELLATTPDDADLNFMLGKALLDARRAADAASRLERASELNPDLPAIWRFWGEALRDSGDAVAARQVWTEGITIADRTGELQAGKEMAALMKKLG